MIRLDKYLANMGMGTRKEVKKSVKNGEVLVNDEVILDPGHKVDEDKDAVVFQGVRIYYFEYVYLMLNKAKGYVSSTDDPLYPTVLELIDPYFYNFEPHPVGRLDVDTTGLLILTNDGQLSHKLTSPRRGVVKTYEAVVRGRVGDEEIEAFKKGLYIKSLDYTTLPADLRVLTRGEISTISLDIQEGKFHQVKNMFKAVGMEVLELKRVKMGSLSLDEDLEEGEYRMLTDQEVRALEEL